MWWFILGFFVMMGMVLLLGLCKVAGEADDRIEQMMREEEDEQ